MATRAWRRTWRPSPVLALEERGGPAGVVYARWWEARDEGAGRWIRRSLGLHLRARAGEAILPDAERRALDLGERMHRALAAGRDPAAELRGGQPLETVLSLFMRAEAPGLSLRHRRDLERAAQVIVSVLGADTSWTSITPVSARALWRVMAERSVCGKGERWAVRTTELLFRVGAWGALHDEVGCGFSSPANWRQLLSADWARIGRGGREASPPLRPRYSEVEARRLWVHLDRADPRLRLAVQVGAPGLRLLQVSRSRRSDLELALGTGEHGLGRLRIRGARGKPGVTVDLDRAARRAVDGALTGLLADRESAYRAGTIEDYALIAGGRLVDGRAPVGHDPLRSIALTTLQRLHADWERGAGVAPRGLRALRRLGVDLGAAEATPGTAPEILDHLGGWVVGSRTREQVYRDAEDLRTRAEAERLRARIRTRLESATACAERPPSPATDRAG